MYDVAIIGAGPAGIAAAKLAAGYGLKTVLLEKEENCLGGTCLNTGCIPTKFFLNSAKSRTSWQEAVKGKKQLIEKIKSPLLKHLKTKGITVKYGVVSFLDNKTLSVGEDTLEAKNIIIATGSSSKKIIEEKKCIFAEDIFGLADLPAKILIVGAGYIGIEFASMLNGFGREVLVVEKEARILPEFDYYFSKRLRFYLEKSGIKIHTGRDASGYNLDEFDIVISATGRGAQVSQLNLANINLAREEGGWIKTDKFLRTNLANIYACGDVTGKKLLAYVAEYQAALCLANITGSKTKEDYSGIAECVFSLPQMASVGILEEEAKKRNIKYRVIKSNFLKFSSSYVYDDTDGFIEVVLDDKDKIIGAGIISNSAGELISLFSYCIRN
ncbi:MAG: NAD(P)/FAD-dependent oxidoreductase, partial [Candidatus Omnitrophota bacterium]